MANDTLAVHPLVKLALENLHPLLEEAKIGLHELAEHGEVRSARDATPLEFEFYHDDVFRNAGALVEALERMEQSQRLIEAASDNSWEGAGLDRHTWIQYHYSYYAASVVGIADNALILTNSVFRLGNREEDCKPDLVTRNWWVAQTPVRGALEELTAVVRPYREGRNPHVHRGSLQPMDEAMGSKLLDQLKLFSFVERAGKPVVPAAVLEKGYGIEIPKISGRLDQERAEVRGRLVAVLDGLFPVYKQKSEELNKQWRPVMEKWANGAGTSRGRPVRPPG